MPTLSRWTASQIIEEFIRNPRAKFRMSEADKVSWERNTDGFVTILKTRHLVCFRLVSKGIYEAHLPAFNTVK